MATFMTWLPTNLILDRFNPMFISLFISINMNINTCVSSFMVVSSW